MTIKNRIYRRILATWIVAGLAGAAAISAGFAQERENKFDGGAKYSVTDEGPIDSNNIILNIAQKTDFTLANSKQEMQNYEGLLQTAFLHRNGQWVDSMAIQRTLGADKFISTRGLARNDNSIKQELKRHFRVVADAATEFATGRRLKGNARGRAIEFLWRGNRCVFSKSYYAFQHGDGIREFDTRLTLLYCEQPSRFDAAQAFDLIEQARLVDADDNRAAYAARESGRRQTPSPSTPARKDSDAIYCYVASSGRFYQTRRADWRNEQCNSMSVEVTKAQFDSKTAPETSSAANENEKPNEGSSVRTRLNELNKLLADGLVTENEAAERRREILKDL